MDSAKENRRSNLALGLLAVGILLGIGALLVLALQPSERAGDVQAIESALIPDPSYPGWNVTPGPAVSNQGSIESEPELPTEAPDNRTVDPNEISRLEELGSDAAPAPVGLRIDAIGVDAPVERYGINQRTGQMDVPRNVQDVAWYEFGPSPGEPGSAVLAAHVDLSSQGPGVFFRLRDLKPGDRVAVAYEDGSESWFVVQARVSYDKEELPLQTIFSRAGTPTLTLITCGGGFNSTEQSYDSNVVVYALPSGQTPATQAAA